MHDDLAREVVVASSPFSYITEEGALVDGMTYKQAEPCRYCSPRRCANEHESEISSGTSFLTCYRGLGVAVIPLSGRNIVLNGLLSPAYVASLSRKDKKRYQGSHQVVRPEAIERWATSARDLAANLSATIQSRIDDTLGVFHDVQTAVSALMRNAEAYVNSQPGGSFEERLEGLPRAARGVVKAVQLLQARMTLLPLLTNPSAAQYGQKHPTPVFRVVDRVVRTLTPLAESKGVSLALRGTSFNQPLAWDSIETIPLILVDNAIKYSMRNQEVEVLCNDVPRGVEVSVSSYSPRISNEDLPHIFERGYRGAVAHRVATQGSGLGLYLAQVVAEAHGTQIRHEADARVVTRDGIEYCTNVFAFRVAG
jgi:signal transduction histidine kinase